MVAMFWKNTVRHTHLVELPRWVRRLSHASELPSHSIYCGDYTRRRKKKWKENPIKCHLFVSHWVHPDSPACVRALTRRLNSALRDHKRMKEQKPAVIFQKSRCLSTLRWGLSVAVLSNCTLTGGSICHHGGGMCFDNWHTHIYINPKKQVRYWHIMFSSTWYFHRWQMLGEIHQCARLSQRLYWGSILSLDFKPLLSASLQSQTGHMHVSAGDGLPPPAIRAVALHYK